MNDFIGCYSNEKGLVIATGGEEEGGEKVNLKNCLAGEMNPGHYTEVCFASFLSSEFTTMTVINPPESKLAKRTSVH